MSDPRRLPSPVECSGCGRPYTNERALRKHVEEHHSDILRAPRAVALVCELALRYGWPPAVRQFGADGRLQRPTDELVSVVLSSK